MQNNFKQLYSQLGYNFKNDKLLSLALSHRSCGAENNERLEFLGDALLGAIIAKEIYHRYPNWDEGKLSRVRANLVNRGSLAKVGAKLKLDHFVKLGAGERVSGGQTRPSILSDCLEAIIAAIFLDADFQQCQSCVLKWFDEMLSITEDETAFKDAKSRLQEYLQKNTLSLAEYTITGTTGPEHLQQFTVKCRQKSLNVEASGIGSSKQQAEQLAAENLLMQLKKNIK